MERQAHAADRFALTDAVARERKKQASDGCLLRTFEAFDEDERGDAETEA